MTKLCATALTFALSLLVTTNVHAISCTGPIWGGGGTTVEVQDRQGSVNPKVRYKAKIGKCVNGSISISGTKWLSKKPSQQTLEKAFGLKLRLHRDFGAGDGGSVNTIKAYKVR